MYTIAMKTKTNTWGGLRANTGLNKIEGGKSYEAKLSPLHIEIAKKLGDGNTSEGIRLALDKIIKKNS